MTGLHMQFIDAAATEFLQHIRQFDLPCSVRQHDDVGARSATLSPKISGYVAEVAVDSQGAVRVTRVFAATDAYHVVNPNLVEAQIEGGVIFGMTAMMYGEINIKNGAAVEGNFDAYQMVRLADAPDVQAHLSLTGGKDDHPAFK